MSDRTNRLLAVLVILMALLKWSRKRLSSPKPTAEYDRYFLRKLGGCLRSNGTADDVLLLFLTTRLVRT